MTMATGARRGFTVARAGLVSAVLWIIALVLCLSLATPPWRSSLLVGVICGIVSGLAGLGLTAMAEGRPLNAALLARVSGFLLRLMLIAAGLVVCIRGLHAEPLGFVFSFFPLFFLSTVLEQVVAMTSRTAPPASNASGGAQ